MTLIWIPFLVVGIVVLVAIGLSLRATWRTPAARRSPGGAHLEFIHGPLDGQRFPITAEITTLGSAPGNTPGDHPENHIVVPDQAVSRKHIGIRRDPIGGGYELADLGSTNGVYVNGQRLAKRLLVAGDIIRIGASEMVFHLEKTR